jgi:hypothetical protein
VIGTTVPPTAVAHAAPALVARTGASGAEHLASFSAGLAAPSGSGLRAAAARVPKGTAGATLSPGQIAVLKMPNAHADAALEGERPRLAVAGAPARVVLLGHGGEVMADRVVASDAPLEIPRGTERIVAIGQGRLAVSAAQAGLDGWQAGLQMPYAGWSTAVAPGAVMRSTGDPLQHHRERLDAGWVTGAELVKGIATVTTRFAAPPRTVVIVLDDPAAFGSTVAGRQLFLGLDGAGRARDLAGQERPPVLLSMENRSVLAYDIVPQRDRPVVVTIASETGWSLVGVMGSEALDATGAVAVISARGLDAVLRPFAARSLAAGEESVLQWTGPTRSPDERRVAKLRAAGQLFEAPAPVKRSKARRPKRRAKRATAGRASKTARSGSASAKSRQTGQTRKKRGRR